MERADLMTQGLCWICWCFCLYVATFPFLWPHTLSASSWKVKVVKYLCELCKSAAQSQWISPSWISVAETMRFRICPPGVILDIFKASQLDIGRSGRVVGTDSAEICNAARLFAMTLPSRMQKSAQICYRWALSEAVSFRMCKLG